MKDYIVRIEITTIGTDFADVKVKAKDEAEARILAGKVYSGGNHNLDYYSSDMIDNNLDTESQKDWIVETVND